MKYHFVIKQFNSNKKFHIHIQVSLYKNLTEEYKNFRTRFKNHNLHMKYQQIVQDIQLLANHRSIQSIEKISTFQYRFIFLLRDSSSIYANTKWQMTFLMPQNYPYSPPKLKFLTPIFHLNVNNNGTVCIGILQEDWTEMGSLYSVIDEVQNILEYPDTTHPADPEILNMYTKNRILYNQKCGRHLQIQINQTSRIEPDVKEQILEQINDLNKMKLTKFSGIYEDFKFVYPSNTMSQQIKFEGQISNIFGKDSFPTFRQLEKDSGYQKIIRVSSPKSSNNSQISNQTKSSLQLIQQDMHRNMFFFDREGNSDKHRKKKIMKDSNLLSIAQSIKGEENSNIFDLSASKDEKCTINMKFSKTLGIQQIPESGQKLLVYGGKRQKNQGEIENTLVRNQISTIFEKSIRYQSGQNKEGQTNFKHQQNRPDLVYGKMTNQQSDKVTKLMQKVSSQLWKSIDSIGEIQKNLKSPCVGKSKDLEKILRTKLQSELENLQRLESLQRQLKEKMIENIQNGICASVK